MGEKVLRVARDTRNDTLERDSLHVLAQLGDGGSVDTQQVGTEAGDVVAGHRGAGLEASAATGHGAFDTDTRAVQIKSSTVVGPVRDGVSDVGSTDGADGAL